MARSARAMPRDGRNLWLLDAQGRTPQEIEHSIVIAAAAKRRRLAEEKARAEFTEKVGELYKMGAALGLVEDCNITAVNWSASKRNNRIMLIGDYMEGFNNPPTKATPPRMPTAATRSQKKPPAPETLMTLPFDGGDTSVGGDTWP